MLITLTTTHRPATDLGYVLRKNPARAQSFTLTFGRAHVFYPEATEERCTAAWLVEVDPVGLVRTRRGPAGEGGLLDQYVNDRPYAASSFLSVAISEVFGTALTGQMQPTQGGGFVMPYNPVGWIETASGELLNLELGGAVSVDGVLVYTLVKA